MEKINPILSDSLRELFIEILNKNPNAIISEIIEIDAIVNEFNNHVSMYSDTLKNAIINNIINPLITDEVSMITIRSGEFDVSFLPKGKEPEYGPNRTWLRKNRQTGKPAKIFQKLLKREFKTAEWEIFTNLFKAALCNCSEFELVKGEDIRHWYLEDNYYKIAGTLGNSCMRYGHAQDYFDIYVDNAQMLITKKDGLLTGRAIVWTIGDITLMDRVYTCFDHLENCFIDYAKEHKWWIRDDQSLLNTGSDQEWYSPDDNYSSIRSDEFILHIPKNYTLFPYMDSFRYYDGNSNLSTHSVYSYSLDSTDGEFRGEIYICDRCGSTFYGYDGDMPEELCYSEYADQYFCCECCWYCDGLEDYISNDYKPINVYTEYGVIQYPDEWISAKVIVEPDGTENKYDIVMIGNEYYFVSNKIVFNPETSKYEVRSTAN